MVKGQASNEAHVQVEMIQVIYSPSVDFKLVTRIDTL
jgi:hypothetical protein